MNPRPMRRQDRALSPQETRDILARGEWGTLATVSADGTPYAVPLNYAMVGETLVFHCATQGHKLDNITANPRVSFSVVLEARVLPELVSTAFRSATVSGIARPATPEEKHLALRALMEKYTRMSPDELSNYLAARQNDALQVVCVDVEYATGKCRPDPGPSPRST